MQLKEERNRRKYPSKHAIVESLTCKGSKQVNYISLFRCVKACDLKLLILFSNEKKAPTENMNLKEL